MESAPPVSATVLGFIRCGSKHKVKTVLVQGFINEDKRKHKLAFNPALENRFLGRPHLDTENMINIGLYYDVKPGKDKEFEQLFSSVIATLRGGQGFVNGALYKRVDKPNSYLIYSEWVSIEGFREFVGSKGFREVTSMGKELLEHPPRHRVYRAVDESDASNIH
jgi:heme-degrading monooxygenase HmoA